MLLYFKKRAVKIIGDMRHCGTSLVLFFLQWNATTTYRFEIERDFGTDYGICCWYTPQLNFTTILQHQQDNNLHEPDWGHFFTNIAKVSGCLYTEHLCNPKKRINNKVISDQYMDYNKTLLQIIARLI